MMAILTETVESKLQDERRTDIVPRLAVAAVFVGLVGAASILSMKPVVLLSVAAMASLGFTLVSYMQPEDKIELNSIRLDIILSLIHI